MTSYVSPTTGKPYTYKSRKLFVTDVRSFLQFHLGKSVLEPYTFDLQRECTIELLSGKRATGMDDCGSVAGRKKVDGNG